jgi:hypothetical protein
VPEDAAPEQVEDFSNTDLKPVEDGIELMNKAGSYVKKIFTKTEDSNMRKKTL